MEVYSLFLLHAFVISILTTNITAEFVSRDSVTYYKQDRIVTIRAYERNVKIDCKTRLIHILSVLESCANKLVSLTDRVIRDCENKYSCSFSFECPEIHLKRFITYNCRSPDELDITTGEVNFTYTPQDGLAVVRCGNGRFVNIVQAKLHSCHYNNSGLSSILLTDLVAKRCNFSQACTFIPKKLTNIDPGFKDPFIYIQFSCVTETFVCRQIACRENSTCKHDGLGPTKCICNDGYIDLNSICAKSSEKFGSGPSEKPPWKSWGTGIPGQLGTLGPSGIDKAPETVIVVHRPYKLKKFDMDLRSDGKEDTIQDNNVETDKDDSKDSRKTLQTTITEDTDSGTNQDIEQSDLDKTLTKVNSEDVDTNAEKTSSEELGVEDPTKVNISGIDNEEAVGKIVGPVGDTENVNIYNSEEERTEDISDILDRGTDINDGLDGQDVIEVMEHMIYTNWLCHHHRAYTG